MNNLDKAEAGSITIDGDVVDSILCEVRIDGEQSSNYKTFSIKLAKEIVFHEIREAGVEIRKSELRKFIHADIEKDFENAMKAYLEILKCVTSSGSRKTIFDLFRRDQKIDSKFFIQKVASVDEDDFFIYINGMIKCLS